MQKNGGIEANVVYYRLKYKIIEARSRQDRGKT